jgi:predicted SpoU family rRNA methylase
MPIKEVAALAVALSRFWHAKGLKFGSDLGFATYFKLQG